MARHQIETQWMGKMQFNSLVNGHTIIMDAPQRAGGEDNGPIPKPFVLTALSGCTGMDIVALLRKEGLSVDDFSMKVTGELSKQQPMQYIAMHVEYDFKGPETMKEAVVKAVTDSQEKYCGVSSMLKKVLPVTWEITYNGVQIFSNKPVEEDHKFEISAN
jgi:Predicted redox protein, regulator of disulfide bond formation